MKVIPEGLQKLERTNESINNPLFRFLEREVSVAQKLYIEVIQNLKEVKLMCQG